MGECEAVFTASTKGIKGLRVKRDEEHHGMCTVDYQDEQVKNELDGAVDCKRQCEDYAETLDELSETAKDKEYDDCLCECKKKVDIDSTGSVRFWPRNLIVMEATLPITCNHFMKESIIDEGMDNKLINKTFKRFERIGCITDKNEIREWVHAHEFVPHDYEPMEQETPAICYLHAKSVGGCRLDAVMRVTKQAMT